MKSNTDRNIMIRLACWVVFCLVLLPAFGGDLKPCSFGVVTDIQYGDKRTRAERHYRKSLEMLPECVATFNAQPLDFVIELGDLMDGYQDDKDRSLRDMESVRSLLAGLKAPLYYVIGNHCVKGGREAVLARLHLARSYYDFTRPAMPGWRFVVLDGTIAGYGGLGAGQTEWFKGVLADAGRAGQRVICLCHFPRMLNPLWRFSGKIPA
jgi:3',5'-cyclic AMP phosphodiesterase CpdA